MGLTDYLKDTETYMWLMEAITEIAEEVVAAGEGTLRQFPGAPVHKVQLRRRRAD